VKWPIKSDNNGDFLTRIALAPVKRCAATSNRREWFLRQDAAKNCIYERPIGEADDGAISEACLRRSFARNRNR
jgi:hypothetical protein